MKKLQIIYLPPGDLVPYEGNARRHSPEDIEAIKKSILEDEFDDPIGIWGDQNIIVEGHGRQIAAIELGLEEVPCIRLDHLSDKQRREYAIRHNRTAELSAWDFSKLEEECARLQIEGQDFPELNFNFDIEIPEDLDAEEGYSSNNPIGCKFRFNSFSEYSQHEAELKAFAEKIGAEISVVKS